MVLHLIFQMAVMMFQFLLQPAKIKMRFQARLDLFPLEGCGDVINPVRPKALTLSIDSFKPLINITGVSLIRLSFFKAAQNVVQMPLY